MEQEEKNTPLPNFSKVQSKMLLESNQTFQKLLQTDIQEEPTLNEIIKILSKKNEWRSREEVRKLLTYFKGLSFFQSLKKESDVEEDIIFQCCRELKYRKYDPKQNIIKFGDDGNEFFIIIEGRVVIYAPRNKEVKFQSLKELYDYIEVNENSIIWDRNTKYLQQQYLEHQREKISSPQTAFKLLMRRSFQAMLGLNTDSTLQAQLKEGIEFQILTKTIELGPGQGFGELALMSEEGKKAEKRQATIISIDEVHCAILEKEDFTQVFRNSIQKKIDAKVEFFKKFRISEGVSKTNLNKLSYILKDKQFRRRDIVYREGDVADYVYFIKEGEFEVTKKVKSNFQVKGQKESEQTQA